SPPYVQYAEPMLAPKKLLSMVAPDTVAKSGIKFKSPVHPSPTELTGASQMMLLCTIKMLCPPLDWKPPRCQLAVSGINWPCSQESLTVHETAFSLQCTAVSPP